MTVEQSPEVAPATAAKRNPSYDVFELRQLQEPAEGWAVSAEEAEKLNRGEAAQGWRPGVDVEAWVLIAQNVRASNDRAAIDLALDRCERVGDARFGTFWAPRVGAFRPRTKTQTVVTQESWS